MKTTAVGSIYSQQHTDGTEVKKKIIIIFFIFYFIFSFISSSFIIIITWVFFKWNFQNKKIK